MLGELDERHEPGEPVRAFRRHYRMQVQNTNFLKILYEDEAKNGYVRVRKVSRLASVFIPVWFRS